ncbi:hypothetical protein L2744_13975 [Shewanella profunda]|uniref:hypothetical protein n=1 Tax=Shewanella profunda TaxID=254793 RepID=UPI00200FC2DB|nr:hypothetical protein [Shewanella profunda]MCL1090680.1 hypothetical protein [Shewanella profunda]
MSLIVLTLVSSLSWVPIADKQALICPLSELTECLETLSTSVRTQLPSTLEQFKRDIGFRSAMVMPVDDSHLSGLILINKQETPQVQFVNIDSMTYQLELLEQPQLTLWHELGHLENIALQGTVLPNNLSAYQQECLADIYLIWRIARESNDFNLAWQQYHRRNLAALTSVHNMSHWSAPMMIQVLNKYNAIQIGQYSRYQDFLADFYPKIEQLEPSVLQEYSSLIQRTFGASVLQPLPKYLFWRKSKLGLYLKPTFVLLMGEEKAHDWLVQNSML